MIANWHLILRLVVAALLGSAVGIERERLLWAAGLRTHMLVCVGACLFMIVSAYGFSGVLGPRVVLDPSRIAAQVVTGVGFLGAGSIIFRNEVVKGLTTAASLWAVAALGLAVGGGLYVPAAATTVIILLILAGVKPLEERWHANRNATEIRFTAPRGAISLLTLERSLGWRASRIRQLVVRPSNDTSTEDVVLSLGRPSARDVEEMMGALKNLPSVSDLTEKRGAPLPE